jgi:MoaA/NifB/PqqE/SkfB family radical SAM enzyme
MIAAALARIPAYRAFRALGRPRVLPFSLTVSPSFACNSRCATCRVYTKKAEELSLIEWEQVVRGFGGTVFWVTMSGGEPFLWKDLPALVRLIHDEWRPAIINIPTNGLLTDRVAALTDDICASCGRSKVVVNVSIDDVGERDDAIRGVPGAYEKAVATVGRLKALGRENLSVGIHSVISRFNGARFNEVYEAVSALGPDSYVAEIAEQRVELGTIGEAIAPTPEEYDRAARLLAGWSADGRGGVGDIAHAFRIEYYAMVAAWLQKQQQMLPCHAGFASAHIAPNGDVWACCVRAEPMGNLREAGYDFGAVWFSPKARTVRRSIRDGLCHCPLANAAYTNMFLSPTARLRAARNYAKARLARGGRRIGAEG